LTRRDSLIRNLILIILDELLQLDAGDTGEGFLGRKRVAEAELFVTGKDFIPQVEEGEVLGFSIVVAAG
jgi:hypothetical protein